MQPLTAWDAFLVGRVPPSTCNLASCSCCTINPHDLALRIYRPGVFVLSLVCP